MANAVELITEISAFMDEVYDMDIIPVEARFGDTVRHITRSEILTSEKQHQKVFDMGYSRAQATNDLDADMPDAGRVGVHDISITDTDMRRLAGSVEYTVPVNLLMQGGEHSAFDIASEKVLEVESDIGERRNALIHAPGGSNPYKAQVSAFYAADGTAYSTSKEAFVKIKTGSPVSFSRGEILEFMSDTTTVVGIVQVLDVEVSSRWRGLDVGPGIRVYLMDGTLTDPWGNTMADEDHDGGYDNTDLDVVVVEDYYIRRLGDASAGGYPSAFANLCPTSFSSALAWFNVTDRRSAGYSFLLPKYRDYTDSGASVDLDLETHFGNMSDTLSYVLGKARSHRSARGLEFSSALVASARPELVRYAMHQAGEPYKRFTVIQPSTLPAAERRKLVAVHGWDDLLIKLPNLPPIALQAERLAREDTIDVYDPSAFKWLRYGKDGKEAKPEWLPGEIGGKWSQRRNVTTGNRTMTYDAGAVLFETLYNESPQSSFSMIKGVKKG